MNVANLSVGFAWCMTRLSCTVAVGLCLPSARGHPITRGAAFHLRSASGWDSQLGLTGVVLHITLLGPSKGFLDFLQPHKKKPFILLPSLQTSSARFFVLYVRRTVEALVQRMPAK